MPEIPSQTDAPKEQDRSQQLARLNEVVQQQEAASKFKWDDTVMYGASSAVGGWYSIEAAEHMAKRMVLNTHLDNAEFREMIDKASSPQARKELINATIQQTGEAMSKGQSLMERIGGSIVKNPMQWKAWSAIASAAMVFGWEGWQYKKRSDVSKKQLADLKDLSTSLGESWVNTAPPAPSGAEQTKDTHKHTAHAEEKTEEKHSAPKPDLSALTWEHDVTRKHISAKVDGNAKELAGEINAYFKTHHDIDSGSDEDHKRPHAMAEGDSIKIRHMSADAFMNAFDVKLEETQGKGAGVER